ncbi:MAG: hypothetical protein PHU23_16090 [Dehalococcoidales bacterium]|nr:hypothetical protein [Dehalococcoidales bacterium]
MNVRKIFFWLILALFVGLTIWWMFYFPYSQEKLYRAIPGNALFVSEHERIAGRWKSIARNPFTLCFLSTAGFKQKDLSEAVQDQGLILMLEKFASKNTVIAYVPSMDAKGEPAWTLSSWIGGSGQIYKWYTSGMLAKANMEKVRIEGGRQIWKMTHKANSSDPELSFAVVDGVLLACLSNDPAGVRHLIKRIECGASVHSELNEQLKTNSQSLGTNGVLDHGFILLRDGHGDNIRIRKITYELTVFGDNTLKGFIRGDMDFFIGLINGQNVQTNTAEEAKCYYIKDSPGLRNLPAVLSQSPDAVAVLPFSLVEPLLYGRYVSRAVRIISKTVSTQTIPNSAIFVSMYGGALSGRVLGIKLPAVMTGVCVKDDSNTVAKTSETVDTLNALYKTSLIPRREEVGGRTVIALDSTRQQGVYDSIAPTDKPAITIRDGWLVISSSLGTLTNVVCGVGQRDAVNTQLWGRGIADVSNCAGYAWVNLESAGESVRNAIAAYSLILIAQNAANTLETRRKLAILQTWINIVKPLKKAELKLFIHEQQFELSFKFGEVQ